MINSEIMNPKFIEIEEEIKKKKIALKIEHDIQNQKLINKDFANPTNYVLKIIEFFKKIYEEIENLEIKKQEKFVNELINRIKLMETEINSFWRDLPFKLEATNQHINNEKNKTVDRINNVLKDINLNSNDYETSLDSILNAFNTSIHDKISEENLTCDFFESLETTKSEIKQFKTEKYKEILEIQKESERSIEDEFSREVDEFINKFHRIPFVYPDIKCIESDINEIKSKYNNKIKNNIKKKGHREQMMSKFDEFIENNCKKNKILGQKVESIRKKKEDLKDIFNDNLKETIIFNNSLDEIQKNIKNY